MSPQGEGINLPPLAPIAEDGVQFRPAHGGQKCFQPGVKVGDVIRFQPGYGEIVRDVLGKRAAHIHYAADHAHAGTFAKDGRKPFAVITADHGLAPAHELEGKTAHILEHPQFRGRIKGIVLHERTGSGPCPQGFPYCRGTWNRRAGRGWSHGTAGPCLPCSTAGRRCRAGPTLRFQTMSRRCRPLPQWREASPGSTCGASLAMS